MNPKPMILLTFLAAMTCSAEEPFALWDSAEPILKADTPMLKSVRFSRIKQREPEVGGFTWLHGVAIARHEGILFTTICC